MLCFRWGWAGLAGAGAAVALWGCANLDSVPSGVCGNRVVDSNEDCDQPDTVTDGGTCGQPGQTGACQWTCGSDGGTQCPSGFRCGIDGICRQPVPSSWTTGKALTEGPAHQLLAADFDGDGLTDIVAVTASSIDLHYSESDRTSTESVSIVAQGASPGLGVLAGLDQAPSLTLALSKGVAVFTGSADRDLASVPFSSLAVAAPSLHAVPFFWSAGMGGATETDFYAYDASGVGYIVPPDTTLNTFAMFSGDVPIGTGVVGAFASKLPCQPVAIGLVNGVRGHVKVWAPCTTPALLADISLPVGVTPNTTAQSLHAVDVDHDGTPDLVIAGSDNRLYVAYADPGGSGSFAPTPAGPFTTLPAAYGPLSTVITVGASSAQIPGIVPLAVGDLNGDCILDLVDVGNIYLSQGTPVIGACPVETTPPAAITYESVMSPDVSRVWTAGQIADLNGDGIPDVAVALDHAGMTIYRGTRTPVYDPVDLATSSAVKVMAVADFDGDLVPDLAYAEVGGPIEPGSMITLDTVSIVFGSTSGPPSDPLVIGQVDGVSDILPATDANVFDSLISNPIVIGSDATTTRAYIFGGNGDRQIVSPYLLLQAGKGGAVATFDTPVRTAVGNFTSPSSGSALGDIAVFSQHGKLDYELWILSVQSDGSLKAAGGGPFTNLPSVFQTSTDALLGNLGPAGGAANDLLMSAVPVGAKVSELVVASAAGSALSIVAQASLPSFDLSGLSDGDGQIFAANVDGKGPLDVVLASATSGIQVVLWDGTTLTPIPALSFDDLIAPCAGMSPKSNYIRVAAFAAGSDGKQGLVAVTPTATVLLTYDGSTLQPTCLLQDYEHHLSPAFGQRGTPFGGSDVAVGDFDGDGIDDIVMSQGVGLVVAYGDSYLPGGNLPTDSAAAAALGDAGAAEGGYP